jgi:hypothetical protein
VHVICAACKYERQRRAAIPAREQEDGRKPARKIDDPVSGNSRVSLVSGVSK